MDAETVRSLTAGEGWGLLQSLPPYEESSALSLQTRLREAGFDPALVSVALTQSRLRARAREKFGDFADGMLFTPDGLEQATRLEVAAVHAQRFRDAGVTTVHDLGCGVGSDAMALSTLDLAVEAVDADEVTALVAESNLRHWPGTAVHHARAEEVALPSGAAARHTGVWLDPARRTPGVADITGRTKRVFRLEEISPSWDFVRDVAGRIEATGAKLSPAIAHRDIPAGCEAQWVSWAGEVVECAIWWGPLVRTAGRTALVLGPTRMPTMVSEAAAEKPSAARRPDSIGPYLLEPDKAVLRAGLVGAVTAAVDGVELDPGVGYVSAERPGELAYARAYVVLESMPFNVKALRAWCRDQRIGRVTIKKRGVTIDFDQLRRQLRLPGKGPEAVLVLTRVAGQQMVLVVAPHA
ncbi:MAG: class I SAM-dependent methyltransferase [Micrococcales bacterium]|nr:class I SAM-dependent methyltransferase [Micrococcales bacterium]